MKFLKLFWKGLRLYLLPLSVGLLCWILMTQVLFLGYVPTSSMEPTIPAGSYILGCRIFSEPKVGDIIIFERDEKLMVKRVAATPGDVVVWDELKYIEGVARPQRKEAACTVPDGCYFVLGGNTQDSWDARYWDDPWVSRNIIVLFFIFK